MDEQTAEGQTVPLEPAVGQRRFYVEHGMIHDRKTGQHVSTMDKIEPGATDRLLKLLNGLAHPTTEDDLDDMARLEAGLLPLRPNANSSADPAG